MHCCCCIVGHQQVSCLKTHNGSRQGHMEMPKNWRSLKPKVLSSRSSKGHNIQGPYVTTIAYKNFAAAKANQEKTRTLTTLPSCSANCWILHWTCITRHRELVHKIIRTLKTVKFTHLISLLSRIFIHKELYDANPIMTFGFWEFNEILCLILERWKTEKNLKDIALLKDLQTSIWRIAET